MWRCVGIAAATCAVIVVGLEFVMPQLVKLFYGDAFTGATTLGRLLLVSAFLAGIRRVLSDGARGTGRPGLGTSAEVSSWVALLLFLPVLIPVAGVNGVAVALILAGAVGLVVLVVGVQMSANHPTSFARDTSQPGEPYSPVETA
jgi:O-antigen/teichoic acid export membrane protein